MNAPVEHKPGAKSPATSMDLKAMSLTGVEVDMKGIAVGTSAGLLTRAIATKLSLPGGTAYALRRDDAQAEYLDDEKSIADQGVTPGERLTIVPKAHLG